MFCLFEDRGMLLTFGSGSHGCLGHGGNTDVTKPKIVEALLGYSVVGLSCGAAHVMVITGDLSLITISIIDQHHHVAIVCIIHQSSPIIIIDHHHHQSSSSC